MVNEPDPGPITLEQESGLTHQQIINGLVFLWLMALTVGLIIVAALR